MESKDKEIILNSSNIKEFELMLNDFHDAMNQMNEKYDKISTYFNHNFVYKTTQNEYDYTQREKSIISNSILSGKEKKSKSKKVADNRDLSQKSLEALGFIQMKEMDNTTNKSEKNDNSISIKQEEVKDTKSINSDARAIKGKTIQESNEEIKTLPKSNSKAKNKKNDKETKVNNITTSIEEDKDKNIKTEPVNNNKKDSSLSLGFGDDKTTENYNQQFFNYKAFNLNNNNKTNTNENNNDVSLKRKNSIPKDIGGKKSKKINNKNWITKEENKTEKIIDLKEDDNLLIHNKKNNQKIKSDFSDDEILNINKPSNHSNKALSNNSNLNKDKIFYDKSNDSESNSNNMIKANEIISHSQSSAGSLEYNSRIQSKEKNYNFNNVLPKLKPAVVPTKQTKFNDYLNFKKINQKIQERTTLIDNINESMTSMEKHNNKEKEKETIDIQEDEKEEQPSPLPEKNQYNFELKSFDDTAYDEFYQLKHNNKATNRRSAPLNNKSIKPKNMPNLLSGVNIQRNKKEREKMQGFKCELCAKFYESIDEKNSEACCNNCSRHRADQKPNSTPKGFYDLSF